ncbi:hypothetical protein HPB47_002089 [Ixodes persulcatus]|uniref:Uncharacterized protein n=1 Tax=Ixodes persulcatus TaxID=34615 RepID=A0AC60PNR4_IXOPE|nr:hypothetical protein HPB47_002089 [Ixodes persulcatus]
MRSLPNDLAVLFRQNIKEKESPTEAGDMQTTTGVPGTAEVANILRFLRIQIESREESQGGLQWSSPDPPQEDRGGTRPSSAQHSLPSALALPTSSVTPEPGSCPLCTGIGHQLQDCNTNISSDTKRNRLRAARCCFRCGKVNHVARNCRTSTRLVCGTCSGRHITILCDIWCFPQDESRPSFTGVSESRTDENRGIPNNVTTAPTTSTGVSSVLLQTTKAWATGTTDSALVRVLLDTGSQRTFIKRESSERLRCPVLGTEELTIYTFGNTKRPTHYRCRRVELTLQSQYSTSKVTVEALEVLQADTEVGVLIGSDVYWKVATGQIRRLSEHLTAVHTIFGWMVQGRYMCPTSDRSNTLPFQQPAVKHRTPKCYLIHLRCGDWTLSASPTFPRRTQQLAQPLHRRGVSVPSGSPKKVLLVKLYRQHVLNDDRFTSGDYSSDEDVRDTSKEHDDSCTLPGCPDSFTSLSDDALLAKPRDFGFQAGPVVASTRSPYERQLRQLLKNGSVPTNPSVPTDEFSATEEEEPQVIPEDNSDDEDGGTPLQKGPTTFSPLSVRSVRFNLSNSNSPGVNEAVQPSRRSFTCSARSSSLPQDGSPVHMTLRSRAGTRGEDMAGHSAATTPAVGKQRRMCMAVKVLIVLVVITVNVLIYLRAPVEQGSFKTNILISRPRIAPIKPVTLPRLELLACLLRARLFDYVTKTLRIAHLKVQFWTDSEVVLCWIAGDATRWQQFVRNRVIEIQCLTEGFPWTHCPSHDNPVECIRVLRDNDVISVVWRERGSENISSAPNCVVRNDGVKRHLEEPDLLPPKKRNPKVAASIEPTVNLFPADDASSCDRTGYAAPVDHCRAGDEIGAPLHHEALCSFPETQHAFESLRGDSVGDVVIVEDDNTPRLLWKLGRVTKMFSGRHGVT